MIIHLVQVMRDENNRIDKILEAIKCLRNEEIETVLSNDCAENNS